MADLYPQFILSGSIGLQASGGRDLFSSNSTTGLASAGVVWNVSELRADQKQRPRSGRRLSGADRQLPEHRSDRLFRGGKRHGRLFSGPQTGRVLSKKRRSLAQGGRDRHQPVPRRYCQLFANSEHADSAVAFAGQSDRGASAGLWRTWSRSTKAWAEVGKSGRTGNSCPIQCWPKWLIVPTGVIFCRRHPTGASLN